MKRTYAGLMAGAAIFALSANSAYADTKKEKELEARIEALEKAFGSLTGQLQASQAENAQLRAAVAQAQASSADAQAKAGEAARSLEAAKPALAAAKQDGFTVGNGSTRIKIGGFLKTVVTMSKWDDGSVAANSLGRDFYLPSAIPVRAAVPARSTTNNDYSAKHTRLWLNLDTTVAGHVLKGYVETDFQTTANAAPTITGGGSERTTNGYNLALRRAYVQFDNLTVGQDWSTFQNVATLPESTDFVGTTEGTVFVRQPLVRYSKKLGDKATLHLAVENGETQSATGPALATVENDQDKMPDIVARLNVVTKAGEFALAGIGRQLRVDSGAVKDTAMGWGVSGSGKLMFGDKKQHDLRFMATYGEGLGRYVGLNFSPDAIIRATGQLETPRLFAGFAALRISLTPSVRTNLMASYQDVSYPGGFAAAYFNTFNETAYSFAGNIFWTPAKGFDLGAEYRHGVRELVSGASGQLDRLEFAAKYSF
ncbi:DcaP family trimeric outer membrane transporter [Sphingobium sp. DEHP117]|uniref:DcaP family trimeric outer membrane transporter n=1 Tax=Sphingobium sp. DEHP117 TaxID=2993436 RepID=UPI0027D74BE1|nr:DcaP family trimeric outer membrane transporter [Sphingobium sp. DEHP117]MDQ4419771.1 DcaP family trimeric outer membrane transporter [Sphingobium sp. DEHP117]